MRAAIYARVSKAKGEKGEREARSIEEQTADCRRFCQQEGWDVTVFSDADISASRFSTSSRPGYAALLEGIEAGQFGLYVIWETARSDRTLETWAALLTACRRNRVRIHVVTHNRTYDPGEARDWRTLAEDGVDNGYESEKTSLRVRRALAANIAAGRPHGPAPYGLERLYDATTKQYITQQAKPGEAEIVSEIITRVAAGEPLSAITADLNQRDVPAPGGSGAWNHGTVRNIAKNAAYIGKVKDGRELADATWQPIVDVTTFWTVQAILSDPARSSYRPGAVRHLLSWLACCAECGSKMTFQPGHGGKAGINNHYRCDRGCTYIRADWLENYISELTIRRMSKADMVAELSRRSTAESDEARALAAALRVRHDEAIAEAASGRLSVKALAAIETALLPQVQEAERKAEKARIPAALRTLPGTRAQVRDRWSSLPVAAKKDAIATLMEIRVTKAIHPGRRTSFDPDRVQITWKKL